MKIIVRFKKLDNVKFVSHLDVQRLFQRAFRRARVPLKYSQGFNPHPVMSFATALSVGYTSNAEWLEIETTDDISPESLLIQTNSVLPDGFRLVDAFERSDTQKTALSTLMYASKYTVKLENALKDETTFRHLLDDMLADQIVVTKKTKGGMKDVDIRPLIHSIKMTVSGNDIVFGIIGYINASGSLSLELLFNEMFRKLGGKYFYSVNRDEIYSADGVVFPLIETEAQ